MATSPGEGGYWDRGLETADVLPKIPQVLMLLLPLFLFYLPASSSSPRFASDLEQARPQTTGEEELQLQLALAMSREEAEKVEWPSLSWGVRHLPYLALSVNTVGQFPRKRQDFEGCLRLVHVPATVPGCSHCVWHPKSPASRWRRGLSLLPVLREDSTRLGSVQPPRPQGELGGSLDLPQSPPPQPGCPPLLRTFGLSSPIPLAYPQRF